MFCVHDFKQSQGRSRARSAWTLPARPKALEGDPERALTQAFAACDPELADCAITTLAAARAIDDVFELLWRRGAAPLDSLGHRAILVAQAQRVLLQVGASSAEPVLRVVARALAHTAREDDLAASTGSARLAVAAPVAFSAPPDAEKGRRWLASLRDLEEHAAVAECAKRLAAATAPATLWDGIRLRAFEHMLQHPGIAGLHAVTTTNALHEAARRSTLDETRSFALLQAKAWSARFTKALGPAAGGAAGAAGIDELAPARDPAPAGELLGLAAKDRSAARDAVLRLDADGQRAFADAARDCLVRKASEAHAYKFCVATLEEAGKAHPAPRPRLLAASLVIGSALSACRAPARGSFGSAAEHHGASSRTVGSMRMTTAPTAAAATRTRRPAVPRSARSRLEPTAIDIATSASTLTPSRKPRRLSQSSRTRPKKGERRSLASRRGDERTRHQLVKSTNGVVGKSGSTAPSTANPKNRAAKERCNDRTQCRIRGRPRSWIEPSAGQGGRRDRRPGNPSSGAATTPARPDILAASSSSSDPGTDMPTAMRILSLLLGISLGAPFAPSPCAQPDWFTPRVVPKARAVHAAVLDVQRSQVVLFGGNTNAGVQGDTWLWSAAGGWVAANPATKPTARREHAMAYDMTRGEVVLFGGFDTAVVGDTWIWNGTTWRNAMPANSPSPRMAEMAWDPASGRVLLFGGQDAANVRLSDTWSWDGTNWTQLQPANTPPPRVDHDLTTDWTRGAIVLFGGWDNGFRGDTWTWSNGNWTAAATTGPAARSEHKMAFVSPNVFLFGGESSAGRQLDSWRWDGTAWTQVLPTGSPGVREEHVLVGGLTATVALLFGGWDSSTGHLADLWTFSGTQWTQLTATQPTGTGTGGMEYDPVAKASILFGGYQDQQVSNQTWSYASGVWTRLIPATSPPARAELAMAYDRVRGEIVIFGGVNGTTYYNDTWVYRGGTWIQRTPASSPPARWGHVMTFDETRGTVLLHSGRLGGATTNLADTWEWNGTTWTQLTPATSPRGREDAGLVFDPVRGEPILFGGWIGGVGFSSETWAFRAGNWVLLAPTLAPSARSEHTMAFDRARGCIVLFGGEDASGRVADTWELTTDWQRRTPLHAPERREEAVMVFDENVDEIVLAVGWDLGHFTDTWHYASRPSATAVAYGTSCQGLAAALPVLTAGRPWLGQNVDCKVTGIPAGGGAALLLGVGQTSFALDAIGMPGCVLRTLPLVTFTMSSAGTNASLALPLPATPSLAGGVIDLQAGVLAPGANPTGVLATNGVELKAAVR